MVLKASGLILLRCWTKAETLNGKARKPSIEILVISTGSIRLDVVGRLFSKWQTQDSDGIEDVE